MLHATMVNGCVQGKIEGQQIVSYHGWDFVTIYHGFKKSSKIKRQRDGQGKRLLRQTIVLAK